MTDSVLKPATLVPVPPARYRPRLVTPFGLLSLILSVGAFFVIVYPLVMLLARTFFSGEGPASALEVLQSPWLAETLGNTLILMVVHGVLALVLGSLLVWLNERTDARIGMLGDILPLVPLLLPAVAMAIGWVFLASSNAGFINGFSGATLGRLGINLKFNVLSWPGLVFVYTLHAVPYVFLIVGAALRNLDPALEEASRTSGAGTLRTFWKVTLPAILPALVSAGLLVVIVGLSQYAIAAIIANRAGIDILSIRVMRLLTADVPPKIGEATVMSVFLMGTALVVWLIQRRVTAKGRFATIGGKSSQRTLVALGPWRWVARACMMLYFLCAAILPVFAMIVVALQPYWNSSINPSRFTLDHFERVFIGLPVTRDAFRNSLMLAAGSGLMLMVIATITTLYSRQASPGIGRILDGVTKLPAAISHVAIAVGFLVAFAGQPFYLGGTAAMLVLVYMVLYIPEASIMAGSAAAQVGPELVEASRVAGASESRTFLKVIFPLMLPGLVAGFALVFVLISGEVTASSLLAKVGMPVIGFAILDIWESGTFGNLAALASAYALMNIIVVLAAFKLGHRPHFGR